MVQYRKYQKTQWTVASLDIVLALIGGSIGLIWDTLGLTMRGYESFKFTTAFIGEIYSTTESQRMRKEAEPSTLDEAKVDLDKSLETSKRYEYHYNEYRCTWFMLKLCCCCKGKPWYKRREKRFKRHKLAEE